MAATFPTAGLSREIASAMVRRSRGPSRLALERRCRRELQLPAYLADFRLKRGRCKRKACASRYGITRLSLDMRSRERIERLATIECAACGTTWYAVKPPTLGEYQTCRLTLILPSEQRRWYARGRWRVEGDDAVVITNATQSDLMSASDDWRKRNRQLGEAKAKAAAKKAEAEAEQHRHTMALLATLADLDAERAAAEAEALAREE